MDSMEEKLGSILNNPDMMRQIMSMAQAMKTASPEPKPEERAEQKDPPPGLPNLDPAMLQRIAGMAQQTGIDREQQALLRALGPYLSRERIRKLENAMRAAKMARIASTVMGSGGAKLLSGR